MQTTESHTLQPRIIRPIGHGPHDRAEITKVDRLLSYRDLEKLTSLSRATLVRRVASGQMPAPLKLGKGRSGRVGFKASAIIEWLNSLPIADRGGAA
jgi:predicted DNA-binding transcriptional regulator AlpA